MHIQKRRGGPFRLIVILIFIIIFLIGMFIALKICIKKSTYKPTITYSNKFLSQKNDINWPNYGQSAIATENYGVLQTYGNSQPQPTASTAKMITSLAVLSKKPIDTNSSGTSIVLSQKDVDLYNYYASNNGSNVKVVSGESITERQALEAVMLPSSNNMADSLAIWAFGSLSNYQKYATAMLKSYGLTNTTIGIDACGFSATTKSTAHDLAIIGLKVLDNQVLASIVREQTATIPVVGTISNVNQLLSNHDEIIGVKTGNTDEAGGVFVLGGLQSVGDNKQNIVTVVMGADSVSNAQNDAYSLFKDAENNFQYNNIVSSNQSIGYYSVPFSNDKYNIKSTASFGMFVWSSDIPSVKFNLKNVNISDTKNIGYATVSIKDKIVKKIPLKLSDSNVRFNNPILNFLFK